MCLKKVVLTEYNTHTMLMKLKHLLNKFGYDVKRYHPVFELVTKSLNIRTVIDIGANVGNFSKEMRNRFPDAHIYAFEPLPDCFATIRERFANDKNCTLFPVALGDNAGESMIERSSFHPSSSLLHMSTLHKKIYPKTKDLTQETIQLARLDDLVDASLLAETILTKIDVQGFEDKVIRGGKNVLSRSSLIIVETSFIPLYENQPLFGDIHNILTPLGFSYYGDMGRHYSPLNGKMLYEDSLYIKDELISA